MGIVKKPSLGVKKGVLPATRGAGPVTRGGSVADDCDCYREARLPGRPSDRRNSVSRPTRSRGR